MWWPVVSNSKFMRFGADAELKSGIRPGVWYAKRQQCRHKKTSSHRTAKYCPFCLIIRNSPVKQIKTDWLFKSTHSDQYSDSAISHCTEWSIMWFFITSRYLSLSHILPFHLHKQHWIIIFNENISTWLIWSTSNNLSCRAALYLCFFFSLPLPSVWLLLSMWYAVVTSLLTIQILNHLWTIVRLETASFSCCHKTGMSW